MEFGVSELLGWSIRLLGIFFTTGRWWQLNIFFYVHPENWGNDAIWLAYFCKGLKPPARVDDEKFYALEN